MPNWCWNSMTIEGPQEKIVELIGKIKAGKDGDACADMAAVTPKKASDYNGNTYLFFSDDMDNEVLGNAFNFSYSTRWGPLADEVIVEASKAYPELRFAFDYDECGNQFMGYDEIKNGVWVDRRYFEGDQYIDGFEASDIAMSTPLEDLPKIIADFDPEADEPEYHCPTAFAIIKARLAGEEITEENFPQVFMKES